MLTRRSSSDVHLAMALASLSVTDLMSSPLEPSEAAACFILAGMAWASSYPLGQSAQRPHPTRGAIVRREWRSYQDSLTLPTDRHPRVPRVRYRAGRPHAEILPRIAIDRRARADGAGRIDLYAGETVAVSPKPLPQEFNTNFVRAAVGESLPIGVRVVYDPHRCYSVLFTMRATAECVQRLALPVLVGTPRFVNAWAISRSVMPLAFIARISPIKACSRSFGISVVPSSAKSEPKGTAPTC